MVYLSISFSNILPSHRTQQISPSLKGISFKKFNFKKLKGPTSLQIILLGDVKKVEIFDGDRPLDTGCSGKNCVLFTIHCNPSLAYIAVSLSKAFYAMRVYSHSYWLVIFCTTKSSRVLTRERRQTFENSWKKTQYLINTLYLPYVKS